jgi:hypothetical protein
MLRNLRVLHRIDLSGLRNGGHCLEIRGSKPRLANGHVLDLELLDDGGIPCYRAHVASTSPDSPVWTLPADLLPLARREIYDGTVLFHGPRCHAVRTVDGVGRGGAAGTVLGAADLGWAGDGWRLDPAAVDGGLQLALLWAEHVLGTAALPMGVAECRPHRAGVISGPATCLVRATRIGSDDAECDVGVLNPDGTPGVELLGVHLVRRPRAQERQPGGRPA